MRISRGFFLPPSISLPHSTSLTRQTRRSSSASSLVRPLIVRCSFLFSYTYTYTLSPYSGYLRQTQRRSQSRVKRCPFLTALLPYNTITTTNLPPSLHHLTYPDLTHHDHSAPLPPAHHLGFRRHRPLRAVPFPLAALRSRRPRRRCQIQDHDS